MNGRFLIFCTGLIDSNPQRWIDWTGYYTDFFAGHPADLLIVNDGPATAPMPCETLALLPHLGRKSPWRFPGWHRSFGEGIKQGVERGYSSIAHIESDCWVHKKALPTLLEWFGQRAHVTGHCRNYGWIETAIQVINDERAREFFLERHSRPQCWEEDLDLELMFEEALHPLRAFNGDRIEGKPGRYRRGDDYCAQCSLAEARDLWIN